MDSFERHLLWDGVEDFTGLWHVPMAAEGADEWQPGDDARDLARRMLESLAGRGLITVYVCRGIPSEVTCEPVAVDGLAGLLEREESWQAPDEEEPAVWFDTTDAGFALYKAETGWDRRAELLLPSMAMGIPRLAGEGQESATAVVRDLLRMAAEDRTGLWQVALRMRAVPGVRSAAEARAVGYEIVDSLLKHGWIELYADDGTATRVPREERTVVLDEDGSWAGPEEHPMRLISIAITDEGFERLRSGDGA